MKRIKIAKKNEHTVFNNGALVAEYVVPSPTNSVTVNNLDIKRDGGIYDIVIMEFDTVGTSYGHVMRINNLIDSYRSNHYNNSSPDGTISAHHNLTNGLGYCNGWSQGNAIVFTTATLMYFDRNWIGCQWRLNSNPEDGRNVSVWGDCTVRASQDNITSFTITALGPTDKIGALSTIRVYKRLGGG